MNDSVAADAASEPEVYHHDGENMPVDGHVGEAATEEKANAYWAANIRLLLSLLAVWFVVSFGAGILFVDVLNKINFFGVPLGFWFAQQGSIYVFVVLIFVYSTLMHGIERKFGVDDD
jgi:putative solute:sodium symporter small subunit